MNKSKFQKHGQPILRCARELQADYEFLEAASTQNVRNPIPMHQLVLTAIPTLPNMYETVIVTRKVQFTAFGKRLTKEIQFEVTAKEALGEQFHQTHGVHVADVVNTLKSKGFLVNLQTVRQTLSNHKANGVICGLLDFASWKEGDRRPRTSYYIPA